MRILLSSITAVALTTGVVYAESLPAPTSASDAAAAAANIVFSPEAPVGETAQPAQIQPIQVESTTIQPLLVAPAAATVPAVNAGVAPVPVQPLTPVPATRAVAAQAPVPAPAPQPAGGSLIVDPAAVQAAAQNPALGTGAQTAQPLAQPAPAIQPVAAAQPVPVKPAVVPQIAPASAVTPGATDLTAIKPNPQVTPAPAAATVGQGYTFKLD